MVHRSARDGVGVLRAPPSCPAANAKRATGPKGSFWGPERHIPSGCNPKKRAVCAHGPHHERMVTGSPSTAVRLKVSEQGMPAALGRSVAMEQCMMAQRHQQSGKLDTWLPTPVLSKVQAP